MSSKKKILFLSPYPFNKAPSQRLKYEQYYPYFKEGGYELTTSSFVSERFWKVIYKPGHYVEKVIYTLSGYLRRWGDLFRVRKYDLVYVHLWVTPIGPPLFESLTVRLAKKVIYDVDDMVHLNDKRKTNHMMSLVRGRKKPFALMRKANHVIVCTPRLAELALTYSNQVTDISSTIDMEKYKPPIEYGKKKPLVIGWSGSHSTSRYLHLLDEEFKELTKELDFTLKVIGDPAFTIEGVKVKAIPWTSGNEVSELREFDIGVYPLPLDEEWVYGKSGLKALQYMALGIPTVATAIGANYRIIEDGVSGSLVEENKDWGAQLRSLMMDTTIRERLGKGGIEVVNARFSVQVVQAEYLEILNETIG